MEPCLAPQSLPSFAPHVSIGIGIAIRLCRAIGMSARQKKRNRAGHRAHLPRYDATPIGLIALATAAALSILLRRWRTLGRAVIDTLSVWTFCRFCRFCKTCKVDFAGAWRTSEQARQQRRMSRHHPAPRLRESLRRPRRRPRRRASHSS